MIIVFTLLFIDLIGRIVFQSLFGEPDLPAFVYIVTGIVEFLINILAFMSIPCIIVLVKHKKFEYQKGRKFMNILFTILFIISECGRFFLSQPLFGWLIIIIYYYIDMNAFVESKEK